MSKMNPDVKRQWVAALRSGEYRQGHLHLRPVIAHELGLADEFCCLGVLCDLHRKAGHGRWSDRTYESADGTTETKELPWSVVRWAGLASPDPRVSGWALSFWNDRQDKTFPEIADLIEEHL